MGGSSRPEIATKATGEDTVPIRLLRLFAVLALVLLPASAQAKRLALVIGIDQYEALPKLQRALNDADAIAKTLEGLGFEVVLARNASRREISKKLGEIETRIAPGDTVLFYFAGHGVAIGGDNILVPADMPLPEQGGEGIVRDEGFAVDGIVRRLRSRGAGATLLILDACRNNPFEESGTRNIGGTRGLTRIEAASGVFVLMSAGTGQTALDRLPGEDANPNSVFTRSLLPLLAKPGMNHIALAKAVQKEVAGLAASAGHAQQPAYYDEILGEIVLNEAGEAAPEVVPAPAVSATAEALAEWTIVKNTTSRQVLEEFIAKHGDVPIYGALAKEALARLASTSAAESPNPESGGELSGVEAETEVAVAAPEAPATSAIEPGVTECDRLAAAPGTPVTRGLGIDGVAFAKIDATAAIGACTSAVAEHPEVARLHLAHGRALDAALRNGEALTAYEKAAGLGDGTAMNNIGVLYNLGDLGKADEAQAVSWFRKSAGSGDVTGMYNLAINLWTGRGTAADPAEAFTWMRRSAEAGNGPAMTQLGAMYEGAVGTQKDEKLALTWYQKAAAENEYRAFYSLAVMLDAGRGTPVNTENAADFMMAAIGYGVEEARRDIDQGASQWSDAFRKALQRRLKEKIGVYKGEIDGVFGAGVKEAVATVFGSAK